MKGYLVGGVLIADPLAEKAIGRRLIEAIVAAAPDLSPEVFGRFEPVKTVFESAEQSVAEWEPPFLWRHRSRVRAEGAIWFANPGSHSAMYLMANGKNLPVDQMVTLVQRLGETTPADFGYVHFLTEAERSSGLVAYDEWYPIEVGVTTHDLRKGLPSVCWGMLFGQAYLDVIGEQRIRSAPWADTCRLANGAVFCQLTTTVDEIAGDLEDLQRRRDLIRVALGEHLFQRPGGEKAVMIPRFAL